MSNTKLLMYTMLNNQIFHLKQGNCLKISKGFSIWKIFAPVLCEWKNIRTYVAAPYRRKKISSKEKKEKAKCWTFKVLCSQGTWDGAVNSCCVWCNKFTIIPSRWRAEGNTLAEILWPTLTSFSFATHLLLLWIFWKGASYWLHDIFHILKFM